MRDLYETHVLQALLNFREPCFLLTPLVSWPDVDRRFNQLDYLTHLRLRVSLLLLIFWEKKMRSLLSSKKPTSPFNSIIVSSTEQEGGQDFAAAPAKHRSTANLPCLGANRPPESTAAVRGLQRQTSGWPAVTHSTRSSRPIELRCEGRERDGQCSDEDKDPPLEVHTHKPTLTSQRVQGRRRGRDFFKITTPSPHPSSSLSSLPLSLSLSIALALY